METFRTVCMVLVLVAAAWVIANWTFVKNAWTYRAQISAAKDVADALGGILQ
jgi:hypothetical protein